MSHALAAEHLRVELADGTAIVDDISLALRPGEVLGLVGESGSGKTTAALALLGYAEAGVRIAGGAVRVNGDDVLGRREAELRRIRGRTISYVPQDPSTALNPSLRVGDQLLEVLRAHLPARATEREVGEALARVSLPADRAFRRRFPHQLSGGQQQRVAIAIALVCEPAVAVLDEPTTGLDVVTQRRIVDEVDRLRRERDVAVVYVSHDLAVVAGLADTIAVMYAGRIVESGPTRAIVHRPRHPYTRGLIASVPDHVVPRRLRGVPGVAVGVGEWPPGCAFAPRCPQRVETCVERLPLLEPIGPGHQVRCFEWTRTPPLAREPRAAEARDTAPPEALLQVDRLTAVHRSRGEEIVAAEAISFHVAAGECLALVGESGSGKTTIARCVVGLHPPADGGVSLVGQLLAPLARGRTKAQRRAIQIVFQNPYDSLNPRHPVAEAIAGPAAFFGALGRREARARTANLLERVRLPARLAAAYPSELSGGERQRVAIARALAAGPELIVCDEITSALDVSVQAAVLELLAELRRELRLSLLFISHDLGVVASISERVIVLEAGRLREEGAVRDVLDNPADGYTRRLLESAPRIPEEVESPL